MKSTCDISDEMHPNVQYLKPIFQSFGKKNNFSGRIVTIECFEDNIDARELTLRLKGELLRLFEDSGGVHMQIGKSYDFKRGLRDEAWSLIKNIKDIMDPKKVINPGVLSLNANDEKD